jgi:hypothetical protein
LVNALKAMGEEGEDIAGRKQPEEKHKSSHRVAVCIASRSKRESPSDKMFLGEEEEVEQVEGKYSWILL